MIELQKQEHFNSIKVRLEPNDNIILHEAILHFNSIKVRLEPIVWGYITSLFSIGFVDAKLINIIEKMSMGDYIFLCVLRQPLYLLVLQQVKDLNDAWE